MVLGLFVIGILGLSAIVNAHMFGIGPLGKINGEELSYDDWIEQMPEGDHKQLMQNIISEDDYEKMQEYRLEREAHREAVEQAIEEADYEKFIELTAENPMGKEITEEEFNQMVERHQYAQENGFGLMGENHRQGRGLNSGRQGMQKGW